MDRRRLAWGALLGASMVTLFAACGDDDAGGLYAITAPANCSSYSACGTCTPVPGCGWCYGGAAGDFCAPDPGQCPTTPSGWTWDATGCRVPAEAGVATSGSSTEDAGPAADAAPSAADAAPGADACTSGVDAAVCP